MHLGGWLVPGALPVDDDAPSSVYGVLFCGEACGVLLKPAAHIQDCREDCVTTANCDAVEKMPRLLVFQDSIKTAFRQFSDGYDSVVTMLRQRHE